ncbi:uncharacterized protein Dmoj_GI27085 [Drosophila mojavensis]|uniref:Uncharacterized protein n=1 Tax=Drosophila mojavensis TaxID=7230 RepID=A0A0Q9WV31_DROMO|nr:uncharacterized protein Dmoj_GI27085 [Drosophila mojavensis]
MWSPSERTYNKNTKRILDHQARIELPLELPLALELVGDCELSECWGQHQQRRQQQQ